MNLPGFRLPRILTSAGQLPFKGIIHVAGIGFTWTSSERAIRLSVINALNLAQGRFISIAFPLIGSGTGGMKQKWVEEIMVETIKKVIFSGEIRIVRFKP